MSIKRADGITESERYLKSLCYHTFLSLWSYPGVYPDFSQINLKAQSRDEK